MESVRFIDGGSCYKISKPVRNQTIDRFSKQEIEEAIARLPAKARRQLVKDIPALCPDEFPADGWDAILRDPTPRPALTSLLDKLDAEYQQKRESYLTLNDKTLRNKG